MSQAGAGGSPLLSVPILLEPDRPGLASSLANLSEPLGPSNCDPCCLVLHCGAHDRDSMGR